MRTGKILALLGCFAGLVSATAVFVGGEDTMAFKIKRKTCRSGDWVMIVYSVCGAGEPALLFIHGGLADRTFWDPELKTFGRRYKVVALDLAGHGESGSNRGTWGVPEFGADVKAVADAERLKRIILFGNSLGGPVAVEAALLKAGLRQSFETGLAAYQSVCDTAADQLCLGRNVVIDAVNGVEPAREMWRALAREHSSDLYFVELVCSDKEEHRKRVESRRAPTPPLPLPTWTEVVQREYQPWNEPILTIDSLAPLTENVARILNHLSR
jgi:pimeloyl-ACP methyl ester carboxylesterase